MTARRTLVVQIDEIAIEDGQIPPPRIGDVLAFPLRFAEMEATRPDTVTIRATLEPSDRPPVLQYTGAHTPRRWAWHGLLRGDGWTASWRGFRPLTGRIELTGRFFGVMGYDTDGRVRGRVTRVQLVSERYRRSGNRSWEVVPGHRKLREAQAAPRFFERPDAFYRHDAAELDRDVGALVDLDLDDVPELPLRPRFVPSDVSASTAHLWVIDRELPLVLALDAGRRATAHVLPGSIGGSRQVWAAPGEHCWVGGADGLFLCSLADPAQRVSDTAVHAAAVCDETLLACGPTWSLHTPGQDPIELETPAGMVTSVAVDGQHFVVALRHSGVDGTVGLVRVDLRGGVTVGPPQPNVNPDFGCLAGTPLRLFRGSTVVEVRPDLTLGPTKQLPYHPFHAGSIGDLVWIVGHPPDGTGSGGWWPLPGPVQYERSRQSWLLTLLDGRTLEPLRSTPIFGTTPGVARDGGGTVWFTASGLHAVPEESMAWPTPLDVANLDW